MPGFKQRSNTWPEGVGILALEVYFPSQFVCQSELENFDNVSKGKYTSGLGQSKMGFCTDREDINSLCLTALSKLMEKTQVGYANVGRLEVGTETIIDKSKSVKTVLMQLFEGSGNVDVEGVDTTNACYGGTAALLNAVNWIESSSWDGRFAVVVAGDIAVYERGPARPTGGAGAVALLVGPNAPLVIERGLRSSFMKHAYDFYKPDLSSEYPKVDGKLSIECYLESLDSCYQSYLRKAAERSFDGDFPTNLHDFDIFAFHSPYCKLVQKSFARLVFNDFLRCPEAALPVRYPGLERFREKTLNETFHDKEVEKAFITFTRDLFEAKTRPSLTFASEVGNMYTPSVYAGLISVLSSCSAENLAGKRIGVFSYGSGLSATMYSLKVVEEGASLSHLRKMAEAAVDATSALGQRMKISPDEYTRVMMLRENNHHKAPYTPTGEVSTLFPGTWYLSGVDELHRRSYSKVPVAPSEGGGPASDNGTTKDVNGSHHHALSNGLTNGGEELCQGASM